MRTIETDADVAQGAAWLAENDPRLGYAFAQTGPLPLRRRPDGFAQLLSAIISQQVSVASAAAIWKRMQDAGLTTEAAVLAAGDDGLRSAGLSRQKIAYSQALANAQIDYVALRTADDAEVLK
jgi:DNA-3-methyladenine glycosylase II